MKNKWIIKVGSVFVERPGGQQGKLCDKQKDAHKWHYKKDANAEAVFWLNQNGWKVEVISWTSK